MHSAGDVRGHDHPEAKGDVAFGASVALNGAFVVAELVLGVVAGSIALIADAAHNLTDTLGLAVAWGAARLAERAPSSRRTYGLRRSTILAALANAALLLFGAGAVSWEAIGRFGAERAPNGGLVTIVAACGIVVNAGSALLFRSRGRRHDANRRAAFVHLAADAAVSAGVVFAGALMSVTGWTWIDPAISLAISAAIVGATWSLLRESLDLALDSVPAHVDPTVVREYLEALPGTRAVHDLHIWALSTTETALTAHIVTDARDARGLLSDASRDLQRRFAIDHATLQLEPPVGSRSSSSKARSPACAMHTHTRITGRQHG